VQETKNRWTKTSSFLVPACGLDVAILLEYGFINAYLDDSNYNKTINDNNVDIFLLFEYNPSNINYEDLSSSLRKHENFLDEYDPCDGFIMVRFKLSDEWKHIKEQLLTSKYSLIDREYVKKYFNPKVIVGESIYGEYLYKDSVNYQILTKSPELKKRWEERLNLSFKDEYEVCSKLDMDEEVYRIG
jgi:hypothetical protein